MPTKKFKTTLLVSVATLAASFVFAASVPVADTGLVFEPPADFKPLTKEITAAKWPSGKSPQFVVGTDRGVTTVAYDIQDKPFPLDRISAAQAGFSKLFTKMIPKIVWKKNEAITLAGQPWLFLEITSEDPASDVYSIIIFTEIKGKTLAFSINSTRAEFPKYEKAIRDSISSIAAAK